MTPTIKDIARILGVANSTVGRALNEDSRISEKMRDEVKRIAAQIGYIPSSAARSMRSGTTTQVGLIVPDFEQNDSATIAKAISERLDEHGFQLVLGMGRDDPHKEFAQVRALVEARAAGVAIISSSNPLPETVMLLKRLPYVQLIRKSPALSSDAFVFNDKLGMYKAAEHLIKLGHQRIAYIGTSEHLSTGFERLQGFMEAHGAAGLPFDRNLIRTISPDGSDARNALSEILQTQRPSGLIAGGSRIAAQMLGEIDRLAMNIPADFSIVGFGSQPIGGWHGPSLTTVGLPVRELALSAGKALIERIMQPGKTAASSSIISHDPSLVVRGSTGPYKKN